MPFSTGSPNRQVLDRADHPAMTEAIEWLSRERIAFARVSDHQLKIGRTLSFYLVKGTIMHDRQKPLPQRGLAALQALLRHPARDAPLRQPLLPTTQPVPGPATTHPAPPTPSSCPRAAPDPSPSNSTLTQISSPRLGTTDTGQHLRPGTRMPGPPQMATPTPLAGSYVTITPRIDDDRDALAAP
jgi:hypothetical protein